MLDTNKYINDYLSEADWRIKENSNANYSFAGLQAHISNTALVKWAMDNMYKGEIAKANDEGFIHIHDLSHPLVGYCLGLSLEDLIKEGFNCGTNFVHSSPPKHLDSLFGQMNNMLFTMSGEWAGAQAFNSVDTFSASFMKSDNLSDREVKRAIRSLVYNLNVKTRIAMQAPFTNFSFDIKVPDDLRGRPCIIGGKEQSFTYGDCQEEVYRFNKLFAEVMIEGDGMGKIFTFPIITYSVTEGFPWDTDVAEAIFTFADEVNSPYFSNFINSDNDPADVRSMCPLTPDTEVFVKTKTRGITKSTIGEIYYNVETKGTQYQVWNPSSGWVNGKPIQTPATKVYEITMSNGEKVKMGENHLQPIRSGEVLHADELEVGMWLPFNKESTDKGDTYLYYSITDIREVKPTSEYLYCFEVDCEDRLFTLANGLITHNCRLRLDLTQLINAGGGLFGSGDKTGSLGVVTINLPRLAYVAKNRNYEALDGFNIDIPRDIPDTDFFLHLFEYFCDISRDSLVIKRNVVQETLEKGLLPYTKKYIGSFSNHFNTLGINGGDEACLNLLGVGIAHPDGKELMVETVNLALKKCSQYQEEDAPLLYNFESSPAEGASTRFARKDKAQFPGIITGGGNMDFYTNSTMLPDDYSDNIFEVFEHQNDLQPLYTSGTVQHIYTNEPTGNWKAIQSLVKKLFTDYRLPYLSISPDITVCPICGRLDGKYEYCPNDHDEEEVRRLIEMGILEASDVIFD